MEQRQAQLEQELAAEQRKRRRAEQMSHQQQVATSEPEVDAHLEAERRQVLQNVRAIRQRELGEKESSSQPVPFDSEYGYLMLEAWCQLKGEEEAGEWVVLTEDAFLQTVEALLQVADFTQRYFGEAQREVVAIVNAFMAGEAPDEEALAALQELGVPGQRAEDYLRVSVG